MWFHVKPMTRLIVVFVLPAYCVWLHDPLKHRKINFIHLIRDFQTNLHISHLLSFSHHPPYVPPQITYTSMKFPLSFTKVAMATAHLQPLIELYYTHYRFEGHAVATFDCWKDWLLASWYLDLIMYYDYWSQVLKLPIHDTHYLSKFLALRSRFIYILAV
jgi:hypothetical protein